jgi:type II secretory pathway pseudopilin PulG
MLVIIMIGLLAAIVVDTTVSSTNINEDIQREQDIKATARALEVYYRSQSDGWPSYPTAEEFKTAVDNDDTTKAFYPGKDAVRAPGESEPSFIMAGTTEHEPGNPDSESRQVPELDQYIYQPRNRDGYHCTDAGGRRCASYTLFYRTTADRTEFKVGDEEDDGFPSVKSLRSLNHQ